MCAKCSFASENRIISGSFAGHETNQRGPKLPHINSPRFRSLRERLATTKSTWCFSRGKNKVIFSQNTYCPMTDPWDWYIDLHENHKH